MARMSDAMAKELLSFLQETIRIPSVNPSLQEGAEGEEVLAGFIADYLTKLGLEVVITEAASGRANLVGRLRGRGGGKTLLLNGHLDTVDTAHMIIDPFDPRYEGGKVFGRGSLDMKAGLAAMVFAAKRICESGKLPKGDVLLTFSSDEEYGSMGSEALAQDCHADGAIVCEPTGLDVVVAHKGFVWSRIDFHGRAAHGSRSDLGVDAIRNAGLFLAALDQFEQETLSSRRHPILGSPSVHASLIEGGTGISTYPDRCTLRIERRTIPGETVESVRREQQELLRRLSSSRSDFSGELDVYFSRSPLEVAKEEAVFGSLEFAFQEALGRKPKIGGFSGWADSALFADAGIPALNFGPSGEGLHAAEEFVDFESVIDVTEVLVQTIWHFCGQ